MHQFTHATSYLYYSTLHGLQYTGRYTCTVDVDRCHFTCKSSHQYEPSSKVSKHLYFNYLTRNFYCLDQISEQRIWFKTLSSKHQCSYIALHQHQQSPTLTCQSSKWPLVIHPSFKFGNAHYKLQYGAYSAIEDNFIPMDNLTERLYMMIDYTGHLDMLC